MRRHQTKKHIVTPEKYVGTIKRNTGYIGYILFTYVKCAAANIVIVEGYNTDFIRCLAFDAYTQQVYEQKRYMQKWDKWEMQSYNRIK